MSFPKVRALHDYAARSEMELSFKKGDLITVLEIRDENWWEGEVDGKEGFVPARYVEHAPTWFYPASDEDNGHGRPVQEHEEADADADVDDDDTSAIPPPPPDLHASDPRSHVPTPKKQPAPNRPNLAKAIKMHHTKAKHEVGNAHNAGLHEFKRAVTKLKKKEEVTESNNTELAAVLRRRNEATTLAEMKAEEEKNMPELQRRFSQRFQNNKV